MAKLECGHEETREVYRRNHSVALREDNVENGWKPRGAIIPREARGCRGKGYGSLHKSNVDSNDPYPNDEETGVQ